MKITKNVVVILYFSNGNSFFACAPIYILTRLVSILLLNWASNKLSDVTFFNHSCPAYAFFVILSQLTHSFCMNPIRPWPFIRHPQRGYKRSVGKVAFSLPIFRGCLIFLESFSPYSVHIGNYCSCAVIYPNYLTLLYKIPPPASISWSTHKARFDLFEVLPPRLTNVLVHC